MSTHFLLLAVVVPAIRRHPGVDEKSDMFSDAVRRVRQDKRGKAVSKRFANLLEEWEGSGWSQDANFSTVVIQIETELIKAITDQHETIQLELNNRMNDLACKNVLVNNAHAASVIADTAANEAVRNEKIEAQKLIKAMTKLKNLDLIRQRSSLKTAQPSYSYPEESFDTTLGAFNCKLDVTEENNSENCAEAFSFYEERANADVLKLETDLALEQTTWNGFAQEAGDLTVEQENARSAAETLYGTWVGKNVDTRAAWKLREHHICYKTTDLAGNTLSPDGLSYYGLTKYTDATFPAQVCKEHEEVPISYQRQHTDFCILDNHILVEQAELDVANHSGSQPDQDYELTVLHTILCILNSLTVAETNLTDTDVSKLVTDCETAERHSQIDEYTYSSTPNLDCKAKVQYTGGNQATTANIENWCFTSFNPNVTVAGTVAVATEFKAFNEDGSLTSPSCTSVSTGTANVSFSGKMEYRFRHDILVHPDPLSDQETNAAWRTSSPLYTPPSEWQVAGYSGANFLQEAHQDTMFIWASDCSWSSAQLSAGTGWESSLSSSAARKCALPMESQYRSTDAVEWDIDYVMADTNQQYFHIRAEVISQCDGSGGTR